MRAPLKERRPPLPTEWGVHEGLGGSLGIVFLLLALVYNQKGAPSSGHAWLL